MSFFARYTPFVSNGGGGGSGVSSLNSLTGALSITGTGLHVNPSGTTIALTPQSLYDLTPALSVDGPNRKLLFTDGTTNMLDWGTASQVGILSDTMFLSINQNSAFWGSTVPGLFLDSTKYPSPDAIPLTFGSTDLITGPTSSILMITGDNLSTGANSDITGDVNIQSGEQNNASSTGNTGQIFASTGFSAGSGNTGGISFFTGTANSGLSGDIRLVTGGSSSNNSGQVLIQTGSAGGTRGDINLDGMNVSIVNGSLMAPNTIAAFNIQTANNSSGLTQAMQIFSGNSTTSTSGTATFTSGNGTSSGNVQLSTGSGTSGTSGNIRIETGVATGNSGLIALVPGSSGATKGKIYLQNSGEGTAGNVWTSTDTIGGGAWMANPAAGANTTLSNLVSPVALNQNLLPASSGSADLGSSGTPFGNLHISTSGFVWSDKYVDSSGSTAISLAASAAYVSQTSRSSANQFNVINFEALGLMSEDFFATGAMQLRFYDQASPPVNYISLRASNTLTSTVSFILPTADATSANQAMVSNGSGQLSFFAGASGTFTTADSKTVTVVNGLITSIV